MRKNNYQRLSKLRQILFEYREPHLLRLILTDSSSWGRISTDGIPPFILPELSDWIPDPIDPNIIIRIVKNKNVWINNYRVMIGDFPEVYDSTVLMPPADDRAWIKGPIGLSKEKAIIWADNFAEALGYDGNFSKKCFYD